MVKLKSFEAYELLLKDVVNNEDDLLKNENRWIWHSIYVGRAAYRIAKGLSLDADYAMALGYIHDIGRKISHVGHPIMGYQYMCRFGFEIEARACLTHSFINNDITLTAGEGPQGNSYLFIKHYLDSIDLDIYDNIIQLCDLFCTEKGYTTIEKRLLDITSRKGVTPNSRLHYDAVIALKRKFDKMLGCDLYSLFPEISEDELASVDEDRVRLLRMIDTNTMLQKTLK